MAEAKAKAEYTPKQKADAAFSIINKEKSWTEVCEELGCSKSTLSSWVLNAKKLLARPELDPNRTEEEPNPVKPPLQVQEGGKASSVKTYAPNSPRPAPPFEPNRTEPSSPAKPETVQELREQFEIHLVGAMLDSIKMIRGWAQTLADPRVIANDPRAVNELGKTVLERADRLGELVFPTRPESDDNSGG